MQAKINILIYINSLHVGGAEQVVSSLCNNLDRERFEVIICWRSELGTVGEELIDNGYEVIGLPEIYPKLTPYNRFIALKNLLQERKIDILHTHDTGGLADGVQCRLIGCKTKLVHTFHFGNYPHLRKRYLALEAIFGRFANQLVAVGHEQANKILSSLHIGSSKLKVIYNGVEQPEVLDSYEIVDQYRQAEEDSVVIGSISTLTTQKGLHHLIDAAAILRNRGQNCIFLIVGGGPMMDQLQAQCDQQDLNHMVKFLGWVPKASENILGGIDIICQSSLWEANSIVLLEALAAGVPTVTTDVGESLHIIDQGKNGLVVKPGDPVALADALQSLLKDRDLRDSMGAQARITFTRHYTMDKMIEKYSRLYERLA